MPDRFWRFKPENKEREKKRLAAAYLARKSEIGARRRARYAANKQRELARNRAWRAKNLDRARAICRQWAKDHPLVMRAIVARRRSLRLKAEGRYTNRDVLSLLAAQNGRCKSCGRDICCGFEVDHVIPLTRGGSNWPANLQLLCQACNRSKSNKLPEEWSIFQVNQGFLA